MNFSPVCLVMNTLFSVKQINLHKVVRYWRGYVWSEVQMICIWSSWYHCHPIISCSSNIQIDLRFWCWLTQVVLEKRPFTVFKALHTGRPPYLTDQLQYYQPTRSLCSSGSHQLVKPRHNLSFESCAFRISAPHIWNSLPTNIREAQSVLTFRRHLKTHYFQSAFSTP